VDDRGAGVLDVLHAHLLGHVPRFGGAKAELNLAILMAKRGRVMSSTLRARPLEQKAATARALEREVLPLFARGALTVPVAETFALEDVAAAYERFAGGSKLGKIILTP